MGENKNPGQRFRSGRFRNHPTGTCGHIPPDGIFTQKKQKPASLREAIDQSSATEGMRTATCRFRFALDKWREFLEDDICIIPIRLDDCAIPKWPGASAGRLPRTTQRDS